MKLYHYAPKDNSKIVALRKLDAKAKNPANIFTYTFGIISALVLVFVLVLVDVFLSSTSYSKESVALLKVSLSNDVEYV
mgnify:CR=1 FL=1